TSEPRESAESVEEDHRDHPQAEPNSASHVAGDLRLAQSAAVMHRYLDDPHAGANQGDHQFGREMRCADGQVRRQLLECATAKHLKGAPDIGEAAPVVDVVQK